MTTFTYADADLSTLSAGIGQPTTAGSSELIEIQGKPFYLQDIQHAIDLLTKAPGTGVKGVLDGANNPLGQLDLPTLAKLSDLLPGYVQHKGKGKLRRAVVAVLQDYLNPGSKIGELKKVTKPADTGKYTFTTDINPGFTYTDLQAAISSKTFASQPKPKPKVASGSHYTVGASGEVYTVGHEQVQSWISAMSNNELPAELVELMQPPAVPAAAKPAAKPKPTYTQKGFFEYNDKTGYVKPMPCRVLSLDDHEWTSLAIAISQATGNVVGWQYKHLGYADRMAWMMAWFNGDMRRCYDIELTQTDLTPPSNLHPGHPANPETNVIIWEAVTESELPTGIIPPGDWPASPGDLSTKVVSNYLLACNVEFAEHMGTATRRNWVHSHLTGNKVRVDAISHRAASSKTSKWSSEFGSPLEHFAVQLFKKTPLATLVNDGSNPERWPHYSYAEYLAEYPDCQPATSHLHQIVAAISSHVQDVRSEQLRKGLELTFITAPDQPKLSGYHTKTVLLDQHDRRWLFKPAAEGRRFRADVEHHVHRLARRWNYATAASMLIEHDGVFGQVQRLFDVAHDLAGWTGKDFLKLTPTQLSQLAREHTLDWAIDNDDTHGENIIVTKAGDVIGIDKGRGWRYFGAWPGLAGTNTANTNCQLIYTSLYNAIAAGHFEQAVIDGIYRDVIAQAHRMQRLPDDVLTELITAAQEHRPHFNPPTYQKACPTAPTNLDELTAAAVARKNNLAQDMQHLWAIIYGRAGWTPPDLDQPTAPARNALGQQLYSGPHDPGWHTAAMNSRNYGTATLVADPHIADASILLWRERHYTDGLYARGSFKVRKGKVFEAMHDYCTAQTVKYEPTSNIKGEHFSPEYEADYNTFVDIFQAIITAQAAGTSVTDTALRDKLVALRTKFSDRNTELGPAPEEPDDPDRRHYAERRITSRYAVYCRSAIEIMVYNYQVYSADAFPPIFYLPKPKHADDSTGTTFTRQPCARPQSSTTTAPKLDDNGDLVVGNSAITDTANTAQGQAGAMTVITLPTGERIEFRSDKRDNVAPTYHGNVEFTVPDIGNLAESMQHITTQLTTMGCPLTPATTQSLEQHYWTHLTEIIRNRNDTGANPYFTLRVRLEALDKTDDPAERLRIQRKAFTELVDVQVGKPGHVQAFIDGGEHLPRFMHMDLRAPANPCGRPYWERPDVRDTVWRAKCMPTACYRNGPILAARTGNSLSTEARTRILGLWKAGMSSTSDLQYGSGGYVFTRQNATDPSTFSSNGVLFNPRILLRTHNYAYGSDYYGKTDMRKVHAAWQFDTMTGHVASNNELMVKDALSILDDIELVILNSTDERREILKLYAGFGITEIRGVPLKYRLGVHDQTLLNRMLLQHHTYLTMNP